MVRIAITGGTGFVGRHLARSLVTAGHEVVLLARGQDRRDESIRHLPGIRMIAASVANEEALAKAFSGCDAVAHCAGINREVGDQTYQTVHVEGTRLVVRAAKRAHVKKIIYVSFLRARPDCGSGYHESKWAAEEIVRASPVDFTIVKPGVIYGQGDHMLGHLAQTFFTLPLFAFVGMKDKPVAPLAVEDLVEVLMATLLGGALSHQTVAVTGPETMDFQVAVRRVAEAAGKRPQFVRMPVWFHMMLAWLLERTMRIPVISTAQVRILSEGIVARIPGSVELPPALAPKTAFTLDQIRKGLPSLKRFGLADLRCCGG